MARKPPRLNVSISRRAQRNLDAIWDYNADFYKSADHADAYVAFLEEETGELATSYLSGRELLESPGLRYMVLRKGHGHGHVVIYEVKDDTVEVLAYFHTRQDWKGKLTRGE